MSTMPTSSRIIRSAPRMEAPGMVMIDSSRIVKEFCQAWSRMDAHELASYFTENGVYHNIPMS